MSERESERERERVRTVVLPRADVCCGAFVWFCRTGAVGVHARVYRIAVCTVLPSADLIAALICRVPQSVVPLR